MVGSWWLSAIADISHLPNPNKTVSDHLHVRSEQYTYAVGNTNLRGIVVKTSLLLSKTPS